MLQSSVMCCCVLTMGIGVKGLADVAEQRDVLLCCKYGYWCVGFS